MLGQVVWPFSTKARASEKFAALTFDFTLTGNDTVTQKYTLSTGWDFITSIVNAYSSHGTGTQSFKIQIRDEENYMDFFISKTGEVPRGSNVTGNGQNPFILPKLHRFKAGSTIEISITDLSGGANTVQVVLAGHKDTLTQEKLAQLQRAGKLQGTLGDKYVAEKNQISIDGDIYIVDRLTGIVADFAMDGTGATYEFKYPISIGANFMWEIFQGYTSASEYTIGIRDELLTEDFFISPIRSSLIVGTGENPFILPRPYLFQGGTNIRIQVTDTTIAAVSSTVQIALIGYKVIKL